MSPFETSPGRDFMNLVIVWVSSPPSLSVRFFLEFRKLLRGKRQVVLRYESLVRVKGNGFSYPFSSGPPSPLRLPPMSAERNGPFS